MNRNNTSIRARILVAMFTVLVFTLATAFVIVDRLFAARLDDINAHALQEQRATVITAAKTANTPDEFIAMTDGPPVRISAKLLDGQMIGYEPVGPVRSATFSVRGRGVLDYATVTLAIELAPQHQSQKLLRTSLLVVGMIVLVGASMLVFMVVDIALKPLRLVGQAAERITNGERGIRLNPHQHTTELGQTMTAIDSMLDELEGAEARARDAEQNAMVAATQMHRFLADAAHELKTPLAGIQSAAETLMRMGPDASEEDRDHLEYLLAKEASRGGHLVSNLLEAARVDAGVSLDLVDVDLLALVIDERAGLRLTRPSLRVVVQGQPLVVTADRYAITSSIRNLVDNGVRAAGPDGVLAMAVRRIGDHAVVDVANTGEPIPEADRERIFHRLVRLSSVASDTPGSGLGLAIARGYARAHGGDITYLVGPGSVEPAIDGRTIEFASCFRVELPLTPPTGAD